MLLTVRRHAPHDSRIFVKVLVQELCEQMSLLKLNERFKDPFLQPYFQQLFPRDNPRNTRFAINFFTSIGLGGLTCVCAWALCEPLPRAHRVTERAPLRLADAVTNCASI